MLEERAVALLAGVLADASAGAADVVINPLTIRGSAIDALLQVSRSAALLAVGRHTGHGFGSLGLGSVVGHVLGDALCPVIITPPSRHIRRTRPGQYVNTPLCRLDDVAQHGVNHSGVELLGHSGGLCRPRWRHSTLRRVGRRSEIALTAWCRSPPLGARRGGTRWSAGLLLYYRARLGDVRLVRIGSRAGPDRGPLALKSCPSCSSGSR